MKNRLFLDFQDQKKRIAYTILSKNYLHFGKVLAESFLKHNPHWDFMIYITDIFEDINDLVEAVEAYAKGYELVSLYGIREHFEFAELEDMLCRYNIVELNTAFKPFVFDYLIARGYEKIVYLDPDIIVLSAIDEIDEYLTNHNIVLTPHILTELPLDSKGLSEQDILKTGIYNLGFIAISNSEESRKFILWWKMRLFNFCYINFEGGMFVDQKWIDFVPIYFENVKILKNKKYNVAYWNLHEREIKLENNAWTIDGEKIVFYHFSGIQLDNLNSISKYQNRFTLEEKPDLKKLFVNYQNVISCKKPEKYSKKKNIFLNLWKHSYDNTGAHGSSADYIGLLNNYVEFSKMIKLNIAGYFSHTLGISEVARSFLKVLCRSGIYFTLLDVIEPGHAQVPECELSYLKRFKHTRPLSDITLSFINADQVPIAANKYPEYFENKYNIGVWWWEVNNHFPFKESFNYVDRILVCSDFVKSSIEPFSKIKISKITYPFYPNWNRITERDIVRNKLNIGPGEFVFIFSFDFHSSMIRKNPIQVIEAFDSAFDSKDNVKLVLKSVHSESFKSMSGEFRDAINSARLRKKIIWIDENMSRNDWISLLNASDCYVTLHRSEGLGLGILESMYLGKPVITTAYGGCMDICNNSNSLLVDYKIVPVKDPTGIYTGGEWAEPEKGSVVKHLREIVENAELYGSISENAACDVRKKHDPRRSIYELYQIFFELYGIDTNKYIAI